MSLPRKKLVNAVPLLIQLPVYHAREPHLVAQAGGSVAVRENAVHRGKDVSMEAALLAVLLER